MGGLDREGYFSLPVYFKVSPDYPPLTDDHHRIYAVSLIGTNEVMLARVVADQGKAFPTLGPSRGVYVIPRSRLLYFRLREGHSLPIGRNF